MKEISQWYKDGNNKPIGIIVGELIDWTKDHNKEHLKIDQELNDDYNQIDSLISDKSEEDGGISPETETKFYKTAFGNHGTDKSEEKCEKNCPDYQGMEILHKEQCDCVCHSKGYVENPNCHCCCEKDDPCKKHAEIAQKIASWLELNGYFTAYPFAKLKHDKDFAVFIKTLI